MKLTLSLTSGGRPVPGEGPRVLDRFGCTIGRGGASDWSLLDPERNLSKTHCGIEYRDGVYVLTDLSTNGVYLNDAAERMERGQPVTLNDGDVLRLGDYEISVRLHADREAGAADDPFADLPEPYEDPQTRRPRGRAQSAGSFDSPDDFVGNLDAPGAGPIGDDDSFAPGRPGRAPSDDLEAFPDPIADPLAETLDDPLAGPLGEGLGAGGGAGQLIPDDEDLIGPGYDTGAGDDDWSGPSVADHAAREQEFFQPPKVAGGAIPDDWDDLLSGEAREEPPPPSAPAISPAPPAASPSPPRPVPPRPAPGPAEAALLRAFMAGAGLDKLEVPPEQMEELMRKIGGTFRQMVEGLCEALVTRSSIKNEFRIERTVLRPKENNPLKFSVTPEEAIRALLTASAAGYLPADRAIQEGFNDIRAHQLAVMAGMQVALRALVKRFDPEALARRLEGHSVMDKVLPGARKARYWDLFTDLYQEIAREAEDDFQNLFGREFSRAYEEQSRKL